MTLVAELMQKGTPGDHDQKLYTGMYERAMQLEVETLIANVGVFVEYFVQAEFH